MKVAINVGVENFNLSKDAIDELIKLGWMHREVDDIHKEKDRQTDIMYSDDKECYAVNFFKHGVDTEEFRTNKDVIDVIERLGRHSSMDKESEFKIVDIPDDVEWYIEQDQESGGHEVIHEKHRTWQ